MPVVGRHPKQQEDYLMALEDVLKDNTASNIRLAEALEKFTAAGGVAGAAAPAAATPKPRAAAAAKPKNTVEQMKAAVLKVKDDIGPEAASAIIAKHVGKEGAKLAELVNMPEKFDAAVADAEAALAGAGADEDPNGGI